MIGRAANDILAVIAKHHDFTLPINVATQEGPRLLGFLEACEAPDKYPELKNMDTKLFATARCELRSQLANLKLESASK